MPEQCNHTPEECYSLYDGYGIYLARVCERCESDALLRFRPDIMTQYETDDQIDGDFLDT